MLDNQIYRVKTPEAQAKEHKAVLSTIARLPAFGLALVAKGLMGITKFAQSQKISTAQALDEAVLALPKHFPDAISKLSDWVKICELAGIPHVPCNVGPHISVEELEKFADDQTATPNTDKLALWILQEHAAGRMWRWESCAPEHLKLYAGLRRVEPQHQNLPKILFQVDERLFHILWDNQDTETAVVSRPWIKPEMFDGFPVEFRVFYQQGGVAACNYYPQRRLDEKYLPIMEQAVELTKKLAAFQVPADSGLPHLPKEFSCDWILTPQGLLFLEAGPPHTSHGGAHPCCFGLFDDKGGGPLPGKRLLTSEPGAQFYIDDRIQMEIDRYKNQEQDYSQTVKRLRMNPKTVAAIMMVQGIIPREMAEKVIIG